MKKKLKQIMNKEEGFTLVELLAVIVILGIIVAIAIPAVGNITQTARSGASDAEQELVVDAAQLYVVDNGIPTEDGSTEGITVTGGTVTITVDALRDTGYLETTESDNIDGAEVVTIEPITDDADEENGNYSYTFGSTVSEDGE